MLTIVTHGYNGRQLHLPGVLLELGQCIGKGASSTVFKGRFNGNEVALKRLHTCDPEI